MQCDVRKMTAGEFVEVYNYFRSTKPSVRWDEGEAYLVFKKGIKELRIDRLKKKTIFYVQFYTGVDNIRFDCAIDSPHHTAELLEMCESGSSVCALDYLD